MMKILIPVDGSEPALRAVDFVIRLSKTLGRISAVLVNVQQRPLVYGEVPMQMSDGEAERYRLMSSERVFAEAESRLKKAGIEYVAKALEGDIAPTIVRHAEECGCTGIVMGTRGMTALGNVIMGSVATKVIHLTKLPVTLVQ